MTDVRLKAVRPPDAGPPEDTLLHRNVLESMSEGVLTVTADGHIGILNPAASQLLGLDGTEVQGKSIAHVLMDREDLEAFNDVMLAAVYEGAVGSRSTLRLRLGDDTERSVAVTTSYLVGREGGEHRKIGLVAVLNEAGMEVPDLVRVNGYVTDKSHVAAFREARIPFLGDVRTAFTLVIVDALASDDWLVEIEAVAAKA